MYIGQDSLEIICPAAVCSKLMDQLVTLTLDETSVIVFIDKAHSWRLLCVLHVEEDFGDIWCHEIRQLIKRWYS